jgi:hypothetical protein
MKQNNKAVLIKQFKEIKKYSNKFFFFKNILNYRHFSFCNFKFINKNKLHNKLLTTTLSLSKTNVSLENTFINFKNYINFFVNFNQEMFLYNYYIYKFHYYPYYIIKLLHLMHKIIIIKNNLQYNFVYFIYYLYKINKINFLYYGNFKSTNK